MNDVKHEARRESDRPPEVAIMHFLLAPVVDHWRGLSLVRFIAILLAIAATHGRFVDDKPLTWQDIVMATLAVCAALGGKYVLAFLNSKMAPNATPAG